MAATGKRKRSATEQTYVVQVERELVAPDSGGVTSSAWADVATVTVKAGQPRAIAIKKGLAEAGLPPVGQSTRVRALDPASAEAQTWGSQQPPPELERVTGGDA